MKILDHNLKKALLLLLLNSICICSFGQEIVLPSKGICAHRGAMNTHPENTIIAFEEAVRLNVQMIELDVRMTKDQKLVILHDETVDRTSDGAGSVGNLTLKEIKQLDAGTWKSAKYRNVNIPTLEEALENMPEDIWLNIHLKGGRELGKKVAKVILKEKRMHQAFIAGGFEAAQGALEVSPEILICNMDRQSNMEEYVKNTIERKSDFIQLYKVPVDLQLVEHIKVLKKSHVKINYCCTDAPEKVKQLLDYGVDFVLVNKVDTIMKAFQQWDSLIEK